MRTVRPRSASSTVSGRRSDPVTSTTLEGGVDPVLVLVEVSLAVEEADADHRQRQVRGGLQEVAGEDAETAPVQRQRAVDAELRAEVGDRALGRDRRRGGGPAELGREGGGGRL